MCYASVAYKKCTINTKMILFLLDEFVSFDRLRTNGLKISLIKAVLNSSRDYTNPVRPEPVEGYELIKYYRLNFDFYRRRSQ